MKRLKLIKNKYNIKNYLLLIIMIVIFLTSLLLNTIVKEASNNLVNISRTLINTISTNTVNNNIKIDLLKKYNMNDLVMIKYSNNKISDIDYNLENAYEILISIKKGIIDNIGINMHNLYNYNINNNEIIVEMTFYNYTNNIFLANLGPKVMVKLSMIQLIDGSIKTKVKTYGINSLLIELYVNFKVTSKIIVPNTKEEDVTNDYDVLISSKVIQGEIPSIYNGIFEKESNIITE